MENVKDMFENWAELPKVIQDILDEMNAKIELGENTYDVLSKGLVECQNNGYTFSYTLSGIATGLTEIATAVNIQPEDVMPKGLTSRKFYEMKVKIERLTEIREAINRYFDAKLPIDPSWIEEYNELTGFMMSLKE
jgi:hypothetical protein